MQAAADVLGWTSDVSLVVDNAESRRSPTD
jgi:hypothetical protein